MEFLVFEDEKQDSCTVDGKLLKRSIENFAYVLRQELKPKSRALVVLPQGLEYIYSMLGCWYNNITVIPTPIVENVLKDEDVLKLIIYMEDASSQNIITNTVMMERLKENEKFKDLKFINVDTIYRDKERSITLQEMAKDDLALLMYTSGSTSKPKGVMLTHEDVMNQASAKQWRIDSKSRMVNWMPQFHAFGLYNNILVPMLHGALSVILSPATFIKNPSFFLNLIRKYKGTHIAMPNFAFDYCTNNVNPDRLEMNCLQTIDAIISAGEPIRKENYENFQNKFKSFGLKDNVLCPLLGLSELCPVCSIKIDEEPRFLSLDYTCLEKGIVKISDSSERGKNITSCGAVEDPVKICIVDAETMRECSPDQIGEVWIKSNCKGSGYLNNPEATKENFYAVLKDHAGEYYFRTGDNGFLYDNYLYIVGRSKEVIIINGKKYHQVDLEWTIKNNIPELVLPISVISCDVENSERVVVIQEIERNTSKKKCGSIVKSIINFISQKHSLEIYEVVLVEKNQIPKTGSGKIRKKESLNRYKNKEYKVIYKFCKDDRLAAKEVRVENENNSIMKTLKTKIFGEVLQLSEEVIGEAESLSELNISSINNIQIARKISDIYAIEFEPYMMFQFSNLSELEKFIRDSAGEQYEVREDEIPNSIKPELNNKEEQITQNDVSDNDIAIIGISCNFPGAADTPEKFWNNIVNGRDCITEVEEERPCIIEDYFYHNKAEGSAPKWGGFITDVDKFDTSFFGISNIEAESMDPQQRKVMEMTWSVIEDGGYNPQLLVGEDIGMYIGVHNNDYSEILLNDENSMQFYGGYADSGVHMSLIANRVSRMLDFHGPSEIVNTACSSSLVAIHNAVEAIKRNECKMAIAGGVNLILSSRVYVACEEAGMLSKDGRCKTFDDSADGFTRAEGYGAVLLKPYHKAVSEHDSIYGIIKGIAVNHDGRSNSLRAPNMNSQKKLIKSVYEKSGISMDTIGYIETHGTGTSLGDPIEIKALQNAYSEMGIHNMEPHCGLGSVKTVIGHSESAAGVAGLIKVLMSMKYKQLAGITNFKSLNKYIKFEDSPFFIIEENKKWDKLKDVNGAEIPRRAGVSSFGFGGTNAHIIVEESEHQLLLTRNEDDTEERVMLLSAKTKESLKLEVQQLLLFLKENNRDNINLDDLSYTLQVVRGTMKERVGFVVRSLVEFISKLESYLSNEKNTSEEWFEYTENKNSILGSLNKNEEVEDLIKICRKNKKYKLLVMLWVNGIQIDWSTLFLDKEVHRLHLPTYPFQRKSYWISGKSPYDSVDINNRFVEKSYVTANDENIEMVPAHIAPFKSESYDLKEREVEHLKSLFSKVSKLPVNEIESNVDMEQYGIDSILIKNLSNELEKELGKVPISIFFQYRTIEALADYLIENYEEKLKDLFEIKAREEDKANESMNSNKIRRTTKLFDSKYEHNYKRKSAGTGYKNEDIAIIGISGKYPKAENLDDLWENLKQGKDCIEEITSDRWDCNKNFDTDKTKVGKINSKWGGLIENPNSFDPLFFHISPQEAEMMDPQERKFLECVYETIEDSGYTRESLKKYKQMDSAGNVGVFVGVTFSDYHLHGINEQLHGDMLALSGSTASIANRISYFFDFNGPSLAVDTMCSSSLTALHLACNSLYLNECKMAIAGGVNLSTHPNKYIYLSQYNFLSTKGKCDSFGNSGDGYVPGEGVGSVFLKKLSDAEADGDHIYGIVKATAVNHGGKTNGFYVPNPDAQADVIEMAIAKARINPEEISYIEAHGTGTVLGDPIEIAGLTKAFRKYTSKCGFCSVGSIKSNIGHLEAAAGIASLTKVLLQMKHRQLVPTVHTGTLNPNIDFDRTPFVVQSTLEQWGGYVEADPDNKGAVNLLTAGISCFGAGGSNSHAIIQEYREVPHNKVKQAGTERTALFVLSSKNEKSLRRQCSMLIDTIKKRNMGQKDLFNIAYTLQTGREVMDERIAFTAQTLEEIVIKLEKYIKNESSIDGFYQKSGKTSNIILNSLKSDEDFQTTINTWFERRKYSTLLKFWVLGLDINWEKLYINEKPRRVSLNTYVFEEEEYWLFHSPTVQAVSQSCHNESEYIQPKTQGNAPLNSTVAELLIPEWKEVSDKISEEKYYFGKHMIFLLDVNDKGIEKEIESNIPNSICCSLYSSAEIVEERYEDYASFLLTKMKELINDKQRVLMQLVILKKEKSMLLRGLTAMLKTAHLEYSDLTYQVAEFDYDVNAEIICERLRRISHTLRNKQIVLAPDKTYIKCFSESESHSMQDCTSFYPWKENGVYIITGGVGELGLLLAREILEQVRSAHIILLGRSTQDDKLLKKIEPLKKLSDNVEYRAVDVAEKPVLQQCIQDIVNTYGTISGLFHTAGVIQDRFLVNKTRQELNAVFRPKVKGLVNLDEATKDIKLDFIVLFSSGAAEMGSIGQADYASANSFMDSYSEYRNSLVKKGERFGKTVSVNWPLWKNGGMRVNEVIEKALFEERGMTSIDSQTGIRFLYQALTSDFSQVMAVVGDIAKIKANMELDEREDNVQDDITEVDLEDVTAKVKEILAKNLKLKVSQIDEDEPFDTYGIDSVILTLLNHELSKYFKKLSATVLFEYNTVSDLAQYLLSAYKCECAACVGIVSEQVKEIDSCTKAETITIEEKKNLDKNEFTHQESKEKDKVDVAGSHDNQPIAIIGVSGCFPKAKNLGEYWENLKEGRNCITEIGEERWDLDGFYCTDRITAIEENKSYCKWGGFLEGFADFDPLFFHMSPAEARYTDPQERIFMEECWKALDDAGYMSQRLDKKLRKVTGVYGAITKTGFELWNNEVEKYYRTSFSSLVNRFSYYMDLQGPSIAYDTMCSSSITALHEACRNLRDKTIKMAVVGAVNLYLHPNNYIGLCHAGLISDSGNSSVFQKDGVGFIPSEGVGAVVLKRLSDAEADKDNIIAVIRGSAVSHSGRTSGYSVPDPGKQAAVMEEALNNAHVAKDTIRHMELAANGSALVDQIEMSAISKVFDNRENRKYHYYTMGNVKSLIGHGEAVSGMAQLIKCILMLRNKVLLPTVIPNNLNPDIDFENIPFEILTKPAAWGDMETEEGYLPRRVMINSFGSGGVYASLVLEEYSDSNDIEPEVVLQDFCYLFVFSTKTTSALKNYLYNWKSYLQDMDNVDLKRISYILQLTKSNMKKKFACIARTKEEFIQNIEDFLNKKENENNYSSETINEIVSDTLISIKSMVWYENEKHTRENYSLLAKSWVLGEKIDWNALYDNYQPKQISQLPAYPFDEKCFWVKNIDSKAATKQEEDFVSLDEICKVKQEEEFDPYTPLEEYVGAVKQTENDEMLEERGTDNNQILSNIKQAIRKTLFHVLYIDDNEDFDERDSFRELGMDSMYMVKFITELNSELILKLDETLLFEYSNVKDLAEYIHRNMMRGE